MRTIKELLQVVLDNKEHFKSGLCKWISQLCDSGIITVEEGWWLNRYVEDNRPLSWYNPYILFNDNNSYYWRKGHIFPRILWLKHHIKKNS